MPKYKFNTGANESYEILPEGDYMVAIEKAEDRYTNSGNEAINLRLTVRDNPQKLFDMLVFTEKAWFRIDQCVKSLAMKFEDGAEVEVTPEILAGKIGKVRVSHEEWNGKTRARVYEWLTDWDRKEAEGWKPIDAQPERSADDDVPF